MPPYWRRWRRRRRPYYTWRSRKAFPRTFRRRRYRWRKRYWVSKKRKLKTIKIKEYQPKTIRYCKIKGLKCLFEGSCMRKSNNYWQYPRTIFPEKFPGGGGWGLQVMSLDSLYEDWKYLQNVWTSSNAGLPLVRLLGISLTFYQQPDIDYVVQIYNCWPMVDSSLQHANTHPQRMLLGKNKLIIPSVQTKPLRKRKKKKFVYPPAQMQNKWYFQKDICTTKFMMIAATACDLTHYYLSPTSESNNITLWTLNTNLFRNADFQHPSQTTGYQPRNSYYLYASKNGAGTPTKKDELVYLGDTRNYKQGTGITKDNWGNPFWTHYFGSIPQYTSSEPPTSDKWNEQNISKYLTEVHNPPFVTIRYNPDKDDGSTNKAYFVSNNRTTGDKSFDPPTDPALIIEGLPLPIMLWGWADWMKKLALIHRIDKEYILVIQTDKFSEKFPYYILIDDSFTQGLGPYDTQKTTEDELNWYPKFWYQQKSIESICTCAAGVNRLPDNRSLEAKYKYTVHLKWGGCPAVLEKAYDPCSQPKWAIPDTIASGFQIQNPSNDPSNLFYNWDVRRDIITQKALERVSKDRETDTMCSQTGCASDPPILLKTHQESPHETSSEEEEETSLQEKLLRLRKRHKQLLKQLLRLKT
nr:MAG: ORF1 [TTV-like mini virus]